jgi:alpha,alpha-trehalose phosphorylase
MLGRLIEKPLVDRTINHQASLYSQGNGYLGIRGTHPEGHRAQEIGCYINGFYDAHKISYGESAYGFPTESDFIVNLPNPLPMDIVIDGEKITLAEETTLAYERTYHFDNLVVERELVHRLSDGRNLTIRSRSMVPREPRNLFLLHYEIDPPEGTESLSVGSRVLLNVYNRGASDDPRVGTQGGGRRLAVEEVISDKAARMRTLNAGQLLYTLLENRVIKGEILERKPLSSYDEITDHVTFAPGPVVIEKIVGYYTQRDFEGPVTDEEVLARFEGDAGLTFEEAVEKQREALARFIGPLKIDVPDHPEVEEALVFNAIHLYNGAGIDGASNLPAKGLSGEGYEGHYFWDTEIYAIPFFTFVAPEVAKGLLRFRVQTLEGARERARQLGHERGAKYPWRTITGRECSAYFPAGTAQYHINADIAYAIYLYEKATGDEAFVDGQCVDLLVETARIWMDMGHFSDRGFCIDAVTGPDEYTAIVDNNYYTNKMAAQHLAYAVTVVNRAEDREAIFERLDLTAGELDRFSEAASKMHLPEDTGRNLTLQDDHFYNRKPWPFEKTREDQYPLLLHFHPLTIYRHRVLKQPDVVLAHILVGEDVALERKQRDFIYYEALTTHDSSLSPSVHGILAMEIGDMEKGYHYFKENLRLDLDNTHKNSDHGLHMAAMSGSWMSFAYGFGGLRVTQEGIRLSPKACAALGDYRFRLRVQGALLSVAVAGEDVTYGLVEGESASFYHGDEKVHLHGGQKEIRLQLMNNV